MHWYVAVVVPTSVTFTAVPAVAVVKGVETYVSTAEIAADDEVITVVAITWTPKSGYKLIDHEYHSTGIYTYVIILQKSTKRTKFLHTRYLYVIYIFNRYYCTIGLLMMLLEAVEPISNCLI